MPYDVDHDIQQLAGHIRRLGTTSDQVTFVVTFKTLFDDDSVAQTLESLAGTLKAAKKKGIVKYGPELLLQGVSDQVEISLISGPEQQQS